MEKIKEASREEEEERAWELEREKEAVKKSIVEEKIFKKKVDESFRAKKKYSISIVTGIHYNILDGEN